MFFFINRKLVQSLSNQLDISVLLRSSILLETVISDKSNFYYTANFKVFTMSVKVFPKISIM